MLNKMGRQGGRKAFSLVEILIVILIIAVLLAVALPQLVGSRDAGLDSAAKQQLNNAYTELSAKMLINETPPANKSEAQVAAPTIKFVEPGEPATKDPNSNARQVSYLYKSSPRGFVIAVAGSGTNCWAIRVSSTSPFMQYLGYKSASQEWCSANNADGQASGWQEFGFPSEAKP
ncbi:MAG: prepilin-type N-terminal cleavage/methylation domain-containing protein [Candidatus Paceibacterota bacterium]